MGMSRELVKKLEKKVIGQFLLGMKLIAEWTRICLPSTKT